MIFISLRYIILGGEALTLPEVKRWLANYPNQVIVNEYGPTEATVATAFYLVNHQNIQRLKNIPIGKPALNSQLIRLTTSYFRKAHPANSTSVARVLRVAI